MKLISLNIFGGRFSEALIKFVANHAPDTDIFCFQEVGNGADDEQVSGFGRTTIFRELQSVLPEHNGYYMPTREAQGEKGLMQFGKATFIKKIYPHAEISHQFIYGEWGAYDPDNIWSKPYSLLATEFILNNINVCIVNVHGMPFPGNKLDTPERIAQSEKILDFVTQRGGEKIIAGDFNLLPVARSLQMFEENGFKNLVKDFNIQTTRGTLAKQLHPEYAFTPEGFQEFADYAFVTAGINVTTFEVPDALVSDHLPMIVEFYL